MNDALWIGLGLVVGVLLGGAVMFAIGLSRRQRISNDLANATTRNELLAKQARDLLGEISTLREALDGARSQQHAAQQELAASKTELDMNRKNLDEQKALLNEAQTKLRDAFKAVGQEALTANSEQFLTLAKKTFETLLAQSKGDVEKKQQAIAALIKPIRELLEKQNTAVGEIEKKREVAYKGMEEQIKQILASNEKLDKETNRLVSALRRPEQRGRWGEMQLRNVVELAGMTEHCDFNEQVQTDDPSTRDRPDMTVNMPGGGVIVIDAKVALDAYLDALQPDADRTALIERHAAQVQQHVRKLANKEYWKQFDHTPRLVVMFMPIESALTAALESKPDLHHAALQSDVLLATPTLLIALLRAIAYGWQQEAINNDAKEIARTGQELYSRLSTFVAHFTKVGTNLRQTTDNYNKAVGSLERNVLSSSRKLKALNVTTDADIDTPPLIETDVRDIVADELRPLPASADDQSGA
jgi:DNA recombination protein RmuC